MNAPSWPKVVRPEPYYADGDDVVYLIYITIMIVAM
jgi:hypothetical protein